MAKKRKQDTHAHNREVLQRLQFDSLNWLSVPRALEALTPWFGPILSAAAQLLGRARSGALPWATRWVRYRDGLQTSHLTTRYPAPKELEAVSPESLIMGIREISEGDNTVVRCWDYVDLQAFNRWLGALAKHKRPETAEKPKPGRIDWDDFWARETDRRRQDLLPLPGAYLKEAPLLIFDLYGVKNPHPTSLRRFKAALYREDAERPKRTSKKRKTPSD